MRGFLRENINIMCGLLLYVNWDLICIEQNFKSYFIINYWQTIRARVLAHKKSWDIMLISSKWVSPLESYTFKLLKASRTKPIYNSWNCWILRWNRFYLTITWDLKLQAYASSLKISKAFALANYSSLD